MDFTSLERHICWCAHTSFNLHTLKFSSGPWSVYSEFIWDMFGLSNRTRLTSIPSVHHERKDKRILQNPPGTGDMRGWLQRPNVTSHHITVTYVQLATSFNVWRCSAIILMTELVRMPYCQAYWHYPHRPLILYTGKEVALYSLLLKRSCNLHSSRWNSYIPHGSPFETVQL